MMAFRYQRSSRLMGLGLASPGPEAVRPRCRDIPCVTRYMAVQSTPMPRDSDHTEDRTGIARELRRGSLELVVLNLLAPREAYGYEIVTVLASRTDGVLAVTDGTLYPVLYRLERAGFVGV